MKFIIQRVQQASVIVQQKSIDSIEKGLLVLVGIRQGDDRETARWMAKKLLKMRIFEDDDGKMNESVQDVGGSLLLVPNFTLYADVSQGNRPGFSEAETPGKARKMYKYLKKTLREETDVTVASGQFGAHMEVQLCNDGPVTLILER
jgi:D-tyrosyl-tRNA(Tyr) deacylase